VTTSSVAIVGLGYVGLPLAVEFGKSLTTFGYDLSAEKIEKYQQGHDPMGEVTSEDFRAAKFLTFSTDPAILGQADVVIVAVPTPVDEAHLPDFRPLVSASTSVGRHMKAGTVVVFESTVYPGATEEVCIPVLERESGLVWTRDFHVGYSPERVNPGDKTKTLRKIVKVVSGDDEATAQQLAELYSKVVDAGIHVARSMKIAEAAKVIENTQRDLNIALMNELAIVFHRVGIDTLEVLEAAGTKWNFLPFRPGLVGGHCIGVDPYYLTHKAEMLGYHPQVILAGRRINDGMAEFIATTTVQHLIHRGGCNPGDTVVMLGLTFKEDCADLRNSKAVDLILHLKRFGLNVVVHDPMADPAEALLEHGLSLTPWDQLPTNAKGVVMAVAHSTYRNMSLEELLSPFGGVPGVFIDIKSAADRVAIERAGHMLWRL
jgi:UDP-N-acetyl-D-galactosamine dehydrogenase